MTAPLIMSVFDESIALPEINLRESENPPSIGVTSITIFQSDGTISETPPKTQAISRNDSPGARDDRVRSISPPPKMDDILPPLKLSLLTILSPPPKICVTSI